MHSLKFFLFGLCLVLGLGSAVLAEGHATSTVPDLQILGFGRLFSNDLLGDGHDRWRSGSYRFSVLQGRDWVGTGPAGFAPVLEYRLHTEILMPGTGNGSGDDRPYAGTVSFGLHQHRGFGATELSVGADVVVVGPQTGLSAFQQDFHDDFGLIPPRGVQGQLADAVYLTGTMQLVQSFPLSERIVLRPFVEGQVGAETLVRAGVDLVLGTIGQQDLWLRDSSSGQLYRGIAGADTGWALVVGADVTRVGDSIYLSESMGSFAKQVRYRARTGLHWQFAPDASVFYGLAWLSPEFLGQPEPQVTGQLMLNLDF